MIKIVYMNTNKLIQKVEETVYSIQNTEHTLDVTKYIQKQLPVYFPNKGLIHLANDGVKAEIHHELFNISTHFSKCPNNIESIIQQYGCGHQKDYCLIIKGHRFTQDQFLQLRGILGKNKLYKLLLMLRLIGFEIDNIKLLNHNPNYQDIIANDLSDLPNKIDHVFIGADVVIRCFINNDFEKIARHRGEIISYSLLKYNNTNIVFTTFPYGDLCFEIIKYFSNKKILSLSFIGSAGSLSDQYLIGDIIIPNSTVSLNNNKVRMELNNHFDVNSLHNIKSSGLHGYAITPLIETKNFIQNLQGKGVETLDTEVAYFNQACKYYISDKTSCGVLLYITDLIGTDSDLSKLDYSSENIMKVRSKIMKVIKNWIELKIKEKIS